MLNSASEFAALVIGDRGEVLDNFFCVFCFSGARFTSDQNGLVFLVVQHVMIGSIGDGKNVRWHFMLLFPSIGFNNIVSVNGKLLVRVNGDQEKTRISLII
jgi:hypothetical protein